MKNIIQLPRKIDVLSNDFFLFYKIRTLRRNVISFIENGNICARKIYNIF